MMDVLEYYEVEKSSGNWLGVGLYELKHEMQYENQLVEEFNRYRVFDGTHPEKLSTLVNYDVAPKEIEESREISHQRRKRKP